LVRDQEYLNNDPLHVNGRNWSYHSFRNADIDTYVTAMEWLADKGYWIIRMGKRMSKRMRSSHPKIIDYAFDGDKSDLLDIWLFANCELCISSSTGLDWLSYIYRKPLLLINFLPFNHFLSYADVIHVPKILQWEINSKELSCSEYWENSFLSTDLYEKNKIKILDLNSEMIENSVKETYQRLNGTWQDNKDDIEKNKKLVSIFKSKPNYSKFHKFFHKNSRMATTWLRDKSEGFFV